MWLAGAVAWNFLPEVQVLHAAGTVTPWVASATSEVGARWLWAEFTAHELRACSYFCLNNCTGYSYGVHAGDGALGYVLSLPGHL